mgnify:CR=1 FL=1
MYFSWCVGCCRLQINVFDLAALLLLSVDRGGIRMRCRGDGVELVVFIDRGKGKAELYFPVSMIDLPTLCWRKPTADR